MHSYFDLLTFSEFHDEARCERQNEYMLKFCAPVTFISQGSDSLSVFQVLGLNQNLMNIKHATHSTTEAHPCPFFLLFYCSQISALYDVRSFDMLIQLFKFCSLRIILTEEVNKLIKTCL